ncbi:MAG TPA: aminopeptidase P family protein [Firmicutes bacterium]|nr:aminopeptidase P family protein [Bacillota bacterium]
MKLNIPDEISHFLITKIENIRYLTNFSGEEGFLIYDKQKFILLVDGRFTTQAKEEVYKDIEVVGYKPPFVDFIFENYSIEKLGFEDTILFSLYNKLREKFELIPLSEVVEKERIVKRENEIKHINEAQKIAEISFLETLKSIKENVTEIELNAELEYQMRKRGGEKNAFDFIILFGERGALPHGKPSNRKLKNGDIIIFDFGTVVDGYHSDCTRMVTFGKITEEAEKVIKIVEEAQKIGIDGIREGVGVVDLDKKVREYIKEKGYGEFFNHSLGHGVGLEIHEKPYLSPRGEGELKTGMVVTIEPGIYLPGKFGVRIEDLLVVEKDGARDLTRIDKVFKI